MAERKLINMVNYTAKAYDDVTLSELEPGSLFSIFETGDNGVTELLALKTEYGNNEGGVDAYLLGSGERLSCDGKTSTKEGCDNIFVRPVTIEAAGPLLYYDKWNELKEKVKADLEYHKSGEMQSTAEAIHGETVYPEVLKEHPRKGIPWHPYEWPDPRPEGEGEFCTPRGVGYDLACFVKSKKAGERLLELVKEVLLEKEPKSWLDWREHEPKWIQFKFQKEEFDLERLDKALRENNNIVTKDILIKCVAPEKKKHALGYS